MPTRIPAISVQATVDGAIRYEGDTSREITSAEDVLGVDIFDISFLPGDPMRYASLVNVSDDQTGADRLHNCEVCDHIGGLDERGTHFWLRRSTASIPAAAVTGVLADATSAHEYGQLHAYVGRNGALARVVRCLAESGSSSPTVHLSTPNTAPASANQDNGTVKWM